MLYAIARRYQYVLVISVCFSNSQHGKAVRSETKIIKEKCDDYPEFHVLL